MSTIIVNPGESIRDAISRAVAGDIVQINAGSYGNISIEGRLFAAGQELRLVANGAVIIKGIQISNSSYIITDGFEITGKPADNHGSVFLYRSHDCTIQNCRIHDVSSSSNAHAAIRVYYSDYNTIAACEIQNCARGVEIQFSLGNLVTDCLARDCMAVPGDSDGFVVYDESEFNAFVRCHSIHNNDDGFDCWTSTHTTFIDCMAETMPFTGDGNGLKLGSGQGQSGDHIVIRCVATECAGCGFNTNNGPFGSLLIDCQATHNDYGFAEASAVQVGSRLYGCQASDNRVNWKLSAPGGDRDDEHVATVADLPAWIYDEAPDRIRALVLAAIGGLPDPDPEPETVIFVAGDGDDTLRVDIGDEKTALAVIRQLADQLFADVPCSLSLSGVSS